MAGSGGSRVEDEPDAELTELSDWCAELGLARPDISGEIADTLVRSGAIDVVVIDSVAALVPKAELEGEMGDLQPGATKTRSTPS